MRVIKNKTCFLVIVYLAGVFLGVGSALAAEEKPKKDKFIDNLLEEVPYSKELKYTWSVMEGDVDLVGVENLRTDIGNRGLVYKTSYIPFVGDFEEARFTAEMGKENRLTFESSHLPLVGQVDGMKFKASVGNDANISIRYKIEFP